MSNIAGREAETLYVYGIIPAGSPAPAVAGIDGAELQTVTAPSGLAAVVHTHRSGPYEGPDEDVKRWVLAHSDVVDDCWNRAGAVLPVSFNVIVRPSERTGAPAIDQLTEWLDGSAGELSQKLGELAGTSELRVEITLDQHAKAADHAAVRELRAEMETRPAGVRRLLEKRLDKLEKQITDQAADELFPASRARIAAHCLQIQGYTPSSRTKGAISVLSVACLVDEPQIGALGAELAEIRDEIPAADIRFLGPWPPYSFVDLTAPGPEQHGDQQQGQQTTA